MRTLLLTALLAGMPMMLIAADDAAFTDLVRKPVNTVCPIDGKPVDTRLQPVDITGPDGQNVMVGSCSDSCQKALRSMFGQDGYDAVKAAKANVTIAAMKASSPTPAPQSSGLATAPQATYHTVPAPYAPAPYAAQSHSATAPYATSPYESTPAPAFGTAPVSEFGSATSTGPAVTTAPKPKIHKHHVAPINEYGEDSDERQIQKKAAQRADMGEVEVDDSGMVKPVVHHHKKKPKPSTLSTTSSTSSGITSPGSNDPWATKPATSAPANNPFAPTTGTASYSSPAPSAFGSAPAPSPTYATPLYSPAPAPASAAPSALPAPTPGSP